MIYFIADHGFYECDNYPKLKNLSRNIQSKFDKKEEILLLGGDNFYPNGLEDYNLNYCVDKFNKCFQSIKHNIYGLLGNHDYIGNINYQLTGFNRDAAIKKSNMFNMPNKYYKIEYNNYDLYMLDTCIIDPQFSSDIYDIIKQYKECKHYNEFTLCDYNIMVNAIKFMQEQRNEQLKWLDKNLEETKKANKEAIVFGHYPIYTTGAYEFKKFNNQIFKYLIPLFIKHNVKLYVSGHDHCTLLQSLNMSTIKKIYELQFNDKLDNDSIIIELFPEFYTYLNDDYSEYKLYNIVSGACIDNYVKNQYISVIKSKSKCEIENINIYENYVFNLYTRINITSNNIICIDFLHNQNFTEHKSNIDKQYIAYSYILN